MRWRQSGTGGDRTVLCHPGVGMVIRRDDRVSKVLARDEGLIDVFVEVSAAFERLRNPAMRRVMSRLVTVEKAARIAGVDADELVRRLNRRLEAGAGEGGDLAAPAGGAAGEPPSAGPEAGAGRPAPAPRPETLDGVPPGGVVDLDVRADLRSGREPFSRIMAAQREVPPGGVLRLRAIFEPVPLYGVLARQGFDHWTERLGEDDWRIWFYRTGDPAGEGPGPPPPAGASAGESGPRATGGSDIPDASARPDGSATSDDGPADEDAAGVTVLDVRGLEPPEPMVRTLEALETLTPGATLVQINVRVPRFLLPRLRERGFTWEIREQPGGPVRVFIRRAGDHRKKGETT